MSDKWIPFGVIALLALILAFAAYTNLEIYDETVNRSLSRQVRANRFYALEKWLAKTGRPVRTIPGGNAARIMAAPEKTVYIQADVFDWDGAAEPLKQWMEAGGFLLVSMDRNLDENGDLDAFLENFGIRAELSDNTSLEGFEYKPAADAPEFYFLIQFELTEAARAAAHTVVEPWFGKPVIRLVEIPVGAGALALIGPPNFMENAYLKREANARLAWDLTGARTGGKKPGVLFIRGRIPVKSLFGRLAERGDFTPLVVSLLILIAVGFWMVIPAFGLVPREKTGPGRPIGERFLAEIRFLKRYHALETYIEVYLGEIKRKLRGRDPGPEPEAVQQALRKTGRLPYSEIIRSLHILRSILERL